MSIICACPSQNLFIKHHKKNTVYTGRERHDATQQKAIEPIIMSDVVTLDTARCDTIPISKLMPIVLFMTNWQKWSRVQCRQTWCSSVARHNNCRVRCKHVCCITNNLYLKNTQNSGITRWKYILENTCSALTSMTLTDSLRSCHFWQSFQLLMPNVLLDGIRK